MKGQVVRSKTLVDEDGYYYYGRIAYYDRKTELVWVVWFRNASLKILAASGQPVKNLVKVMNWR